MFQALTFRVDEVIMATKQSRSCNEMIEAQVNIDAEWPIDAWRAEESQTVGTEFANEHNVLEQKRNTG